MIPLDLPTYLTVGDVQNRYRIRTPRAARAFMREAGAIEIARRLVISPEALARYEQSLASTQAKAPNVAPARRRARTRRRAVDLTSLSPDFYDE